MLGECDIVAFLATTQADRARAFYCDVLGLELAEDTPFALVLTAANATLRLQKVAQFTPAPFTALGWQVADIAASVARLVEHGVGCLRFDGMGQDASAIWTAPGGAKICWFKDPDGNTLSLTQSG